ncbi:MAG: hypothetical protein H6772_02255 [Pseudomonadales bacterium]|nr:hypothetical protein [Pseudomonadales bacterium]
MLSQKAIIEFQKIYQEELGTEISIEEASERAEKFLRLFKMIYQPIPDKWLEEKTDK